MRHTLGAQLTREQYSMPSAAEKQKKTLKLRYGDRF